MLQLVVVTVTDKLKQVGHQRQQAKASRTSAPTS
jgi:hypothetical protein